MPYPEIQHVAKGIEDKHEIEERRDPEEPPDVEIPDLAAPGVFLHGVAEGEGADDEEKPYRRAAMMGYGIRPVGYQKIGVRKQDHVVDHDIYRSQTPQTVDEVETTHVSPLVSSAGIVVETVSASKKHGLKGDGYGLQP